MVYIFFLFFLRWNGLTHVMSNYQLAKLLTETSPFHLKPQSGTAQHITSDWTLLVTYTGSSARLNIQLPHSEASRFTFEYATASLHPTSHEVVIVMRVSGVTSQPSTTTFFFQRPDLYAWRMNEIVIVRTLIGGALYRSM